MMKTIEEGYLIRNTATDEYCYPNFGIYTKKRNAEYQCSLRNNMYKGTNDKYEVVKVKIIEVDA